MPSDEENSHKTILLVEDNPDDRDLTLLAFEQAQISNRVDVCEDGQDALDYLFNAGKYSARKQHKLPEVVLLDLQLPKISGLEVLKEIRANAKTRMLPVVILTSSREERDMLASYNNHANSYVRKPVDFLQFVEAARQLGLYWLVLNEQAPGNAY